MKKALLIGIQYTDISGVTLRGCVNDIVNMRNMLIDAYDYEPQNIVMLRDDDPAKFPSPTLNNIFDHIIGLVLESANLEEIWLHYSGHGSQLQNTDCSLNQQNYEKMIDVLVPIDFISQGCISDCDLYDMIRRIKCRAILTFDCCHSGTMCDLPWTIEYDIPRNITTNRLSGITDTSSAVVGVLVSTKISNVKIKNPYIFMLSGCKDDQTSSDTINNLDQRTGAFTNALCECLRNSHHNTSILSLYKDICIYLLENGYNQIPILSTTVESPTHIICKKMPTFRHQYRNINEVASKTHQVTSPKLGGRLIKPSDNRSIVSIITNSIESLSKENDLEEISRALLPIFGSGSQSPSVSTISNGTLSRLGRHYYCKLE
jgi:hypothetical protein